MSSTKQKQKQKKTSYDLSNKNFSEIHFKINFKMKMITKLPSLLKLMKKYSLHTLIICKKYKQTKMKVKLRIKGTNSIFDFKDHYFTILSNHFVLFYTGLVHSRKKYKSLESKQRRTNE